MGVRPTKIVGSTMGMGSTMSLGSTIGVGSKRKKINQFFFETKMTKIMMMMEMMVKIVNCRPAALPVVKTP